MSGCKKISNKIIFLLVSGLLILGSFSAWTIINGNGQVSSIEEMYSMEVRPLDDLRRIQLLFGEIEFRMAGVAADMVAPIGAGEHLKNTLGEIDRVWAGVGGGVNGNFSTDKKDFERAYYIYKNDIALKLEKAYFSEDKQAVVGLSYRWHAFKPLLLNSIDRMAEAQQQSAGDYSREKVAAISWMNMVILGIAAMLGIILIVLGFMTIRCLNTKARLRPQGNA